MSLTLVATPIGNQDDLSLRAKQLLIDADIVIVEEFKESTKILRAHGIKAKALEQLNEHSTPEDLLRLLELARSQKVALISDCGTPSFQDPGSDLVALCRKNNIQITTAPGASSLMALLSLSSRRINSFQFAGFLPANTEERGKAFAKLAKEDGNIILMDTPYRMRKTIAELAHNFADRKILFGIDLTQDSELVYEESGRALSEKIKIEKAEFIALIYSKK